MKIKEYPDVDGLYWYRANPQMPFEVVRVCGPNRMTKIGSPYVYDAPKAEWIGPLMPDGVEIYISKQTKNR